MRVCVAAICRNESKFILRFLEHVKGADAISLVDTGSEDNTAALISGWCAEHPDVEVHFMYDTEARNLGRSRQLAASVFEDEDLIVWLDIDEHFSTEDWPQILRDTVPESDVGCWITMHNGGSIYRQLKVYKKSAYRWRYRAHEVLIGYGAQVNENSRQHDVTEFHTVHTPDADKPRNYLPELAADATEFSHDERALFYYGRELCYAIIGGDESVTLTEAQTVLDRLRTINAWDDYQVLLATELMCAQYMRGVVDERITNFPMSLRPDRVESYGTAADIYMRRGATVKALSLALDGIAAPNDRYFLFTTVSANLELCLDIACRASRELGLLESAIYYGSRLAQHTGQDIVETLKHYDLFNRVQFDEISSQKTDPEAEVGQRSSGTDAELSDQSSGDQN